MKVLYIGGTGQISWSCVHRSHETWILNRGNHNADLPAAIRHVPGDTGDDRVAGLSLRQTRRGPTGSATAGAPR